MLTKRDVAKLAKLKKFLEQLPDSKFNMDMEVRLSKRISPPPPLYTLKIIEEDCGSACCLFGWMAAMKGRPFISARKVVGKMLPSASDYELTHMYFGRWSPKMSNSSITRQDAIEYLDKVIKSRNMVQYFWRINER